MGYDIHLSIAWTDIQDSDTTFDVEEAAHWLAGNSAYFRGVPEDKIAEFLEGGQDSCRWYAWQADLSALSENWAGILFSVRWQGEDSDDLGVAYFLDGRYYTEALVEPPFDPQKLPNKLPDKLPQEA